MVGRFVIRLLDATGALLGWADVRATAQPGGVFRVAVPTPLVVTRGGTAVRLSIFWADLDVARAEPLAHPLAVGVGETVTLDWSSPVWVVAGEPGVPLPPVTVGSHVQISPATGGTVAAPCA